MAQSKDAAYVSCDESSTCTCSMSSGSEALSETNLVVLLGMDNVDLSYLPDKMPLDDRIKVLQDMMWTHQISTPSGRDTARVLATETATPGITCITVSNQAHSLFSKAKHVTGNFAVARFPQNLSDITGGQLVVQIDMDTYWIPDGTWQQLHWGVVFFSHVLPALASLLDLKRAHQMGIQCGIFLPFTFHCFRQIVENKEMLASDYEICFVSQDFADKHNLLAKGTKTILHHIPHLGKTTDQDEKYCGFNKSHIKQSVSDQAISEELSRVLARIEDFDSVKQMFLRRLDRNDPADMKRGGLKLADTPVRRANKANSLARSTPKWIRMLTPSEHAMEALPAEQKAILALLALWTTKRNDGTFIAVHCHRILECLRLVMVQGDSLGQPSLETAMESLAAKRMIHWDNEKGVACSLIERDVVESYALKRHRSSNPATAYGALLLVKEDPKHVYLLLQVMRRSWWSSHSLD